MLGIEKKWYINTKDIVKLVLVDANSDVAIQVVRKSGAGILTMKSFN